jgi:hypothetical protein
MRDLGGGDWADPWLVEQPAGDVADELFDLGLEVGGLGLEE